MQSRGAIIVFAVAFALVCLFQLSFSFFTAKVESDAEAYAFDEETYVIAERLAGGDELKEAYLVDSIAKAREQYYLDNEAGVYNILIRKYSYQDAKERELNLGLDLKGGMNVILEVKVGDIVNALSGYNEDPLFRSVMNETYARQRYSSKDFVTLFGETWEEMAPDQNLSSYFTSVDLRDKITYNSTNAEVISVIREETNDAIDRAFNILRTRIDRFGVSQPNISKLATAGRILVELPGIKDPARIRKLLQGTAQLEFWETYQLPEIVNDIIQAEELIKRQNAMEELLLAGDTLEDGTIIQEGEVAEEGAEILAEGEDLPGEIEGDTTDATTALLDQLESDSIMDMPDASAEEMEKAYPLRSLLQLVVDQEGRPVPSATIGYARIQDTARINSMLKRAKEVFPINLRLAWMNKPRQADSDILELVGLKITTRDRRAPLTGDVIVDARQDYNQMGQVEVSMTMNSDGAKVWRRLTADNVGKQIAIVLDDYVYSYPNVNGEIPNGMSSITGIDDLNEAKDLANILKAGKLPAPARIVEEEVVGPSLGAEAVTSGLWSFVIAFILVLIYMIFFYNRAGWVANLALVTNIFFIFGVLASLQAVLTLPGIAGIVLTIGMAVDANVIIYERIKEEIRAGKGMRLAIADGYKNAYSAIIDGNVTTLLTGIVLYVFGTGPVQGFATTLIIGILSSLFSAIFISRLIFTSLLNKNKKVSFDNKFTRNWLANVNIDFLGMRRKAYIFSSLIILAGIVSLFTRGLNPGVDFSGGRTFVVRFDQPVSTADIRNALTAEFEDVSPEVKTFGPTSQVKITTKYLIDDKSAEVDSIIQVKLFNSLKPFYLGQDIGYRDFSTDVETEDKLVGILSSQKVDPVIADDIMDRAWRAIGIALLVIFVYIAIRFKRWQFGLAGLAALIHDSLIIFGVFSIFYSIVPFSMEIDQAFIAAILTIVGYSINDTVIIFDRIREYTGLFPKRDTRDNMNAALNSTLARTINTSGTTLVVLVIIFIFGGEVIRGFTFALLMGILIGTYSSLFTASPIAYDMLGGDRKLKGVPVKSVKQVQKKKKK
ncbi:MAG: protein translocase subunit SecDF [Bacteroidales bacterium]|jgi:SecD/SecF fusion protein|nr:protein translocase subunit SecDF [Bacteroidales bacterium]